MPTVEQPAGEQVSSVPCAAGAWSPRRVWRRFWARAPRQLRFTREGKVVVALAFAVGGAAINTGNNLLMLAWGLMLSSIVISGLLSEGTLRPLELVARRPLGARVGEPAALPMLLSNRGRRLPAFGVEASLSLAASQRRMLARAPYLLRVEPGETRELLARLVPIQRGLHVIRDARAETAYPFGFFRKTRRYPAGAHFWVAPRRLLVDELLTRFLSRWGEASANRVGAGDDFFSLRPFRAGDDLRHVHWRRSARTGRWVVRENEAWQGQEVLLELVLAGVSEARAEVAIAYLGSLAEELLLLGLQVGVRAPGVLLSPQGGAEQAARVLAALARLDASDSLHPLASGTRSARVALAPAAGVHPPNPDLVLSVPRAPTTAVSGTKAQSGANTAKVRREGADGHHNGGDRGVGGVRP